MKNNKTMNSAEYIEVTLRIEPFSEEAAEIVEAELCDLPYDSFVIEEDALKAYIPKDAYDARALKVVLSGVPYKTSFSANLVPYQNWNRQWENEFEPIIVGRDVTVKAWHHTREDLILAYAAMGKPLGKTRFTIKIDPQMAFGTGHHQTTYMMMEAMMEIEDRIRGHVVMDMGCGTGVLGILAAKLHAAHVYGIDIDAVAAQSAYDNAHGNGSPAISRPTTAMRPCSRWENTMSCWPTSTRTLSSWTCAPMPVPCAPAAPCSAAASTPTTSPPSGRRPKPTASGMYPNGCGTAGPVSDLKKHEHETNPPYRPRRPFCRPPGRPAGHARTGKSRHPR